MDLYRLSIFFHMRAVHECAARLKVEAAVDLADYSLEIRGRNRQYRFYPQFYVRAADGRVTYSPHMGADTRGFVGWLPYFNKRWDAGVSKLAFKEFCAANNLPTPRWWTAPEAGMRDFLVKRSTGSSFGEGIRGPFRSHDPRDAAQSVSDQQYYEAFVPGRIIKAYYWNDTLAALELKNMPSVQGDGKSSLHELIKRAQQPTARQDELEVYRRFAAYQDLSLEAAPAAGAAVTVDFRYGSHLYPVALDNANVLAKEAASPLVRQLSGFGPALWSSVPEALRPATLCTVDGILDEQGKVWLLEMNCNPALHPDVYRPMIEGLFGPPAAADQDPAAVMAPPPLPGSALPPLPARSAFASEAPLPPPGQPTVPGRWLS